MVKYVLTVDAGGIRSFIPAFFLEALERRTKKSISQTFDLMAGTSTGALLVAALCSKSRKNENAPRSVPEAIEVLEDMSSQILRRPSFGRAISFALLQKPNEKLRSAMQKHFGSESLSSSATNLMMTSFDFFHNSPLVFKSWKENHAKIQLGEAASAAISQVTHFSPTIIHVDGSQKVLFDATLYAYNPALCAYASCKSMFPDEEIVLLSLGTGRIVLPISDPEIKKVAWMDPISDIVFAASADAVDYQMTKFLHDKYMRIQSEIPVAIFGMKNISKENMKRLREIADSWIEWNEKILLKFDRSS